MDYKKIYDELINNAKLKNRVKLKKTDPDYIYYENHHIIPRCLGGTDEEINLILLTAREHFIAHKLLALIHNDKNLVYACVRLAYRKNGDLITSARDYEFVKHLLIKIPMSQEIRDKISKTQQGRTRSDEFKEKQRQSHLGTNSGENCNFIKYIEENRKGKTLKSEMIKIYGEDIGTEKYNQWIENMRNAKLGKKLSEEHKENIGKSHRGKKRTEKAKENMRLGWIKRKQNSKNKNNDNFN